MARLSSGWRRTSAMASDSASTSPGGVIRPQPSGEEDGRAREAEGAARLSTIDPGRIEEVGVDAVRDQYSAEAAGERGGRCGDCRSGARGARQQGDVENRPGPGEVRRERVSG